MASITSANAVITITIPGVYNVPVQLQGFSADNIYDTPAVETVQTAMGVDGILSGGFVYNPIPQTFSIQADSASNKIFEDWDQFQRQAKDVFTANASVTLISVGTIYTHTKGFLSSVSKMPTAGRILQPRQYTITWESVFPQPA